MAALCTAMIVLPAVTLNQSQNSSSMSGPFAIGPTTTLADGPYIKGGRVEQPRKQGKSEGETPF